MGAGLRCLGFETQACWGTGNPKTWQNRQRAHTAWEPEEEGGAGTGTPPNTSTEGPSVSIGGGSGSYQESLPDSGCFVYVSTKFRLGKLSGPQGGKLGDPASPKFMRKLCDILQCFFLSTGE